MEVGRVMAWRKRGLPHGAETPERDESAGGRVVGAVALGRDAQRRVDDSGEALRQRPRGAGRRAIETTEVGIRVPAAHLRDHLVADVNDGRLDRGEAKPGRTDETRGPGRSHGLAGERVHGLTERRRLAGDAQRDEDARLERSARALRRHRPAGPAHFGSTSKVALTLARCTGASRVPAGAFGPRAGPVLAPMK